MKIKKTEFAKLLSPHTRSSEDINLDAKQWGKILSILKKVIGQELLKGNSIFTPFGEFYRIDNPQRTIKSHGEEIPIKNKYQVRCSCSESLKEIVNAERK
jgi:nucleoid DNA-binding protein